MVPAALCRSAMSLGALSSGGEAPSVWPRRMWLGSAFQIPTRNRCSCGGRAPDPFIHLTEVQIQHCVTIPIGAPLGSRREEQQMKNLEIVDSLKSGIQQKNPPAKWGWI